QSKEQCRSQISCRDIEIKFIH
ncbi:unnamed protein product, partial [Callosobruchus maculatus]